MNSNPATCLICLKNNYNEKGMVLYNLLSQEWNSMTYLNKLQNILSAEVVSIYKFIGIVVVSVVGIFLLFTDSLRGDSDL